MLLQSLTLAFLGQAVLSGNGLGPVSDSGLDAQEQNSEKLSRSILKQRWGERPPVDCDLASSLLLRSALEAQAPNKDFAVSSLLSRNAHR